jgi:C4-dicarboxylate transporter DctM subunit
MIPILVTLFEKIGINPIHGGIFIVLNLVIGFSTPPFGTSLFLAASIAKIDLQRITKWALIFSAVAIIVLLIVTFVPMITMWLPNFFSN